MLVKVDEIPFEERAPREPREEDADAAWLDELAEYDELGPRSRSRIEAFSVYYILYDELSSYGHVPRPERLVACRPIDVVIVYPARPAPSPLPPQSFAIDPIASCMPLSFALPRPLHLHLHPPFQHLARCLPASPLRLP